MGNFVRESFVMDSFVMECFARESFTGESFTREYLKGERYSSLDNFAKMFRLFLDSWCLGSLYFFKLYNFRLNVIMFNVNLRTLKNC